MISLVALAVALLARWRRMTSSALFLLAVVAADVARPLLAPLRAGVARPYDGAALALFLSTDVALFLAPPGALLFAVGARGPGVALWLASTLAVAVTYPAIRGAELLRFYAAVYLAAYALAALVVTWRGLRAERLTRDEQGVLFLCTSGAASVVLVLAFGVEAWWCAWITNGTAYGAVAVLAGAPPRPRERRPRAPRCAGPDERGARTVAR